MLFVIHIAYLQEQVLPAILTDQIRRGCKRVSPSYFEWPASVHQQLASQCSANDREVLNNRYKCAAPEVNQTDCNCQAKRVMLTSFVVGKSCC